MKAFLLVIPIMLFSLVTQSQTKNFIDQPYLEVNGSADTLLTPNEIFIRILITEKDTKDKVSVETLELKMFNAIKGLGIDPEKNLTTNDIASNFKSYLLKEKDILKSKQYILKVGDAVLASKVFIKLEELGISNTSIDHVGYSGLESLKNVMRSKAVENAKMRALALTRPLNQSIGSAIQITDNEYSQQIQGRVGGIMIRGLSAPQAVAQEPPKIEFEKINITININVKFILK